MNKCHNCGKDISDYAIVCPNCGARTNPSQNNNIPKMDKKKIGLSKKAVIILGIAFVVLSLSVFVFVCSVNAHNAITGKSMLGIGSIFFEKMVYEGYLRPIYLTKIISLLSIIVSICVMGLTIIKAIKNSKDSSELGK